jgi:hypothetical protein
LSTALIVGCGKRDAGNAETQPENAGAPEVAGAPLERPEAQPNAPPASREDASTVRGDRIGTSGSRTAGSARPSAAREAAPARTAERASPPTRSREPEFREVAVPGGTALPLELTTPLSSETAQVETPVRARLRQAVVVDDYTVLPAGAVLTGHVTDVDRAGLVQGRSRLAFRFTAVQIDGNREELLTNPLTFQGEATKGEDAAKIGGGAIGGAIIGGILGGGDGAAKWAAIGGAAGTGVVLATRGRDVTLASGTDLAATLAEPFSIRVRR